MTTETLDVQLPPIWQGRTMSAADEARLDAMAAEADAERAERIATEERLLAEAGVIRGSLDDLQLVAGINQEPVSRWQERNRQLVDRVASGEQACCGEWQWDGYYGWCSLLGRPSFLRDTGERREMWPILNRCDGCPVAKKNARIGDWFADLLSEMDAICKGEIDV
jgi:hypothetical protein